MFQLGEEAFNQPFKTGPLIDQDGQFRAVRHPDESADVRLHRRATDLYSKAGPGESSTRPIEFPTGNIPARIRIRATLRDGWARSCSRSPTGFSIPQKNKNLLSQFHTSDALIYFPDRRPPRPGRPASRRSSGWSASMSATRPISRRNGSGPRSSMSAMCRTPRMSASRQSVAALQFLQGRVQEGLPRRQRHAAAAVGPRHHAEVQRRLQEPGGPGEDGSGLRPQRGGGPEQAVPRHPEGHRLGKLHAARDAMAQRSTRARPIRSARPRRPISRTPRSKPTARDGYRWRRRAAWRVTATRPPIMFPRPLRISPSSWKKPSRRCADGYLDRTVTRRNIRHRRQSASRGKPEDIVTDLTRRKCSASPRRPAATSLSTRRGSRSRCARHAARASSRARSGRPEHVCCVVFRH